MKIHKNLQASDSIHFIYIITYFWQYAISPFFAYLPKPNSLIKHSIMYENFSKTCYS